MLLRHQRRLAIWSVVFLCFHDLALVLVIGHASFNQQCWSQALNNASHLSEGRYKSHQIRGCMCVCVCFCVGRGSPAFQQIPESAEGHCFPPYNVELFVGDWRQHVLFEMPYPASNAENPFASNNAVSRHCHRLHHPRRLPPQLRLVRHRRKRARHISKAGTSLLRHQWRRRLRLLGHLQSLSFCRQGRCRQHRRLVAS